MKKVLFAVLGIMIFSLPVFAQLNINYPYDGLEWIPDVCNYDSYGITVERPVMYTFDVLDPDTCWYEVYNSTGLVANISLSGCTNTTEWQKKINWLWIKDYGSLHTLRVYGNDTSGNIYSDEISFTPYYTLGSASYFAIASTPIYDGDTFYSSTSEALHILGCGGSRNVCYQYINGEIIDTLHAYNCGSPLWIMRENEIVNYTVSKVLQEYNYVIHRFYGEYPYNESPYVQYNNPYLSRVYFNLTQSVYLVWDTRNPEMQVLSPVNGQTYRTRNIDINISVYDLSLYYCAGTLDYDTYHIDVTLEHPEFFNCQNITLTNLSDGEYNITISALDRTGKQNLTTITFYVNTSEEPEEERTMTLFPLISIILLLGFITIIVNMINEIEEGKDLIEFVVMMIIGVSLITIIWIMV